MAWEQYLTMTEETGKSQADNRRKRITGSVIARTKQDAKNGHPTRPQGSLDPEALTRCILKSNGYPVR
jgi:hypothetical protein